MAIQCRIEISTVITESFSCTNSNVKVVRAENISRYGMERSILNVIILLVSTTKITENFRRLKMIKLSTGVEISENTVINALQKAGISVELPKHIFQAGDVAKANGEWRFIVKFEDVLYSVDKYGNQLRGITTKSGQDHFVTYNYKYVGRQSDLLKE